MNPCCHQKEDGRQPKTCLFAQDKTFPQKRTARGFTLIELLVVISIISLLISILLPSLAAARDSAKAIQCASNERGLGMVISFYAENNKQYYPTGTIYSSTTSGLPWGYYLGYNYLNIKNSTLWTIGNRPPSILACPNSTRLITNSVKIDYATNWRVTGNTNQVGAIGSLRVTDFSEPSGIILAADGASRQLNYWSINPLVMAMEGRHKRGLAGNDINNVVNVLYCDGHVAAAAMNTLIVGLNATAFGKRPWKP